MSAVISPSSGGGSSTSISNAGGTVSIDDSGAVHVTPADGQNTNIAGGALAITASAVIDGDFADSKAVDGHRLYVGMSGSETLKATLDVDGLTLNDGVFAGDGSGLTNLPGGVGDVVGPASSTDNAIARFDSTTGKLLKNSGATIDDAGGGAFTTLSLGDAGIVFDSISRRVQTYGSGIGILTTGGSPLFATDYAGAAAVTKLTLGFAADNFLLSPAANTIAQRNGANPQNFAMGPATTDGILLKQSNGGNISFRNGDDSAGASVATGAITIGGGASITRPLTATATLNFGSIPALTSTTLDMTLTNAAVGDAVNIGGNPDFYDDMIYVGFVPATDTVRVIAFNTNAVSARDPSSGTFRASIIQF